MVTQAAERWDEVISAAAHLVESCTCETACYDCLKDFSNQTHHEKLNECDAVRRDNTQEACYNGELLPG